MKWIGFTCGPNRKRGSVRWVLLSHCSLQTPLTSTLLGERDGTHARVWELLTTKCKGKPLHAAKNQVFVCGTLCKALLHKSYPTLALPWLQQCICAWNPPCSRGRRRCGGRQGSCLLLSPPPGLLPPLAPHWSASSLPHGSPGLAGRRERANM